MSVPESVPEPVAESAATSTAQAGARARRRAETEAEIVEAAWGLARVEGLAGFSMRQLGRAVGMRAQSLYGYVASKGELYDAMFRQAHGDLAERTADWGERLRASEDPVATFVELNEDFARWCVADPARYQLLFQRVVPDWEPSADTYALAVAQLDQARRALAHLGLDRPEHLDLWSAVMTGLTSQQVANDPGGDRWIRLVGRAVDAFVRSQLVHQAADATADPGEPR